MDRIDYPRVIEIDVGMGKEDASTNHRTCEKYSCIAIVIHSGSSLHYGHYYSYIHSQVEGSAEWLLANDSQMSSTSFDGLMANLDLFKNDTPYVLFYARLKDFDTPEITVSRRKLVDLVEQDNRTFEVERTRSINSKKRFQVNNNNNNFNNNNHERYD